MTYSIIVKEKKGWFEKKIKNVKGHYFPKDVPGFMIIVHDDESSTWLQMECYKKIKVSKESFLIKTQRAKEESKGLADIKESR